MTQEHLLYDKPGLDGLSEPDVIGDQQIGARHVDCAHERVQLEVFDTDPAAEWRLEIAPVSVRCRAPNDGIKECLKCRRIV